VIRAAALAVFLLAAGLPAGATPPPVHHAKPSVYPPLTAHGWGRVRVGMTQAEVVKVLGPVTVDDEESTDGGCTLLLPKRGPKNLYVMLIEGKVGRVSIWDKNPIKTDRGLGLGATEDQVKAAYGKRLVIEPHAYDPAPAHYLTYWTVKNEAGVRYETDEHKRVRAIHVGNDAIQGVEDCA
jgi:hypothetical protein